MSINGCRVPLWTRVRMHRCPRRMHMNGISLLRDLVRLVDLDWAIPLVLIVADRCLLLSPWEYHSQSVISSSGCSILHIPLTGLESCALVAGISIWDWECLAQAGVERGERETQVEDAWLTCDPSSGVRWVNLPNGHFSLISPFPTWFAWLALHFF